MTTISILLLGLGSITSDPGAVPRGPAASAAAIFHEAEARCSFPALQGTGGRPSPAVIIAVDSAMAVEEEEDPGDELSQEHGLRDPFPLHATVRSERPNRRSATCGIALSPIRSRVLRC